MANEKEFVKLLQQHQNIIHKVSRLYVDSATDREDLFQEITLQAWKAYGSFRQESLFSTWLYRVALNTAITFFKKDKGRTDVIILSETLPDSEKVETNANIIETQVSMMYEAISHLSKIDKALVMLYLEDYNYNEIGAMLDITPNHVAVKMNRIKQKLKEKTASVAI